MVQAAKKKTNKKAKDRWLKAKKFWFNVDMKLVEGWFRLVEYSIVTGALYYAALKTGNKIVYFAFFVSIVCRWLIAEVYTDFLFSSPPGYSGSFSKRVFKNLLSILFFVGWIGLLVVLAKQFYSLY